MKKGRSRPVAADVSMGRSTRFDRPSLVFYFILVLGALGPGLFFEKAYFEGDLIGYFIPVWDFIRHSLAGGHWPLWCPYLLGGQPFAADPNCMVFYPPAYLYLIPSRALGSGFYYGLHLFLAFLGAHLWLRAAGFSTNVCRVGAVLYGLSGFFWWELIHPPVLTGYAWLPWWGFALEEVARTSKRRWAFAGGVFLALLFLSGHFQVFLGAVYGGAVYFLFRVLALSRGRWQSAVDWKKVFLLSAVLAWGALPLLVLAVPFLEFSNHSGRVHQTFDYLNFNADLSDNPRMLFKFFFPSPAFGQAFQPDVLPADILENAGYLGIWFPFLFFLAFRNTARRLWFWFWSGCGVLALLMALGKYTPLHRFVCERLLGFEFVRAPYRFVYLYVVAGVFLAALGLEFLETRKPQELKKLGWGVFFYAGVLSGAAFFRFPQQAPALVGLGLGGAGLWIWFRGRSLSRAGRWLFAAGLALSMILGGWRTCPSRLGPESNFDFAKNRPELLELRQRTGLGRTFIDGDIDYPLETGGKILIGKLPPDAALSLGIRDVQGYNPLSLWKTSQLFWLPFESTVRLLAVQSIIKGTGDSFTRAGFKQAKLGSVYFCFAPKPYPYVYAPERFEVVPSDERRLTLMGQKDFNPYLLSYLSDAPPAEAPAADLPKPDELTYQLIRDDPDEQVFQVQRKQSGWTVFSEVVYPGWKVWVDGKRTALLTANHVFRTVYVPAGEHEVRFSYEPVWWTPIRAGLCLWLLSVLALVWRPWRQWAWGN